MVYGYKGGEVTLKEGQYMLSIRFGIFIIIEAEFKERGGYPN